MEKILMIIVGAAALGIILLRGAEISASEDGLWTAYPHSGACPDSPVWESAAARGASSGVTSE